MLLMVGEHEVLMLSEGHGDEKMNIGILSDKICFVLFSSFSDVSLSRRSLSIHTQMEEFPSDMIMVPIDISSNFCRTERA